MSLEQRLSPTTKLNLICAADRVVAEIGPCGLPALPGFQSYIF